MCFITKPVSTKSPGPAAGTNPPRVCPSADQSAASFALSALQHGQGLEGAQELPFCDPGSDKDFVDALDAAGYVSPWPPPSADPGSPETAASCACPRPPAPQQAAGPERWG